MAVGVESSSNIYEHRNLARGKGRLARKADNLAVVCETIV
jgi:hypothetical protein